MSLGDCDYVEIIDGDSQSDSVLIVFTDKNDEDDTFPKIFTSTASSVIVKMHSDDAVEARGFNMTYYSGDVKSSQIVLIGIYTFI